MKKWILKTTAIPVVSMLAATLALGNAGPFIVKYPGGDTAAKGVLARLDPSLKPGKETSLEVLRQDLAISILPGSAVWQPGDGSTPLAQVSAAYSIKNPTAKAITVDFGFPILRGIYVSPFSMMPRPDVDVHVDGEWLDSTIISNSAIYGIIRRSSREVIDKGISADAELGKLVKSVKKAKEKSRPAARKALKDYLEKAKKWSGHDAALMSEYAGLDFSKAVSYPKDREMGSWATDAELQKVSNANLGALSAIGEQKATQLLARLATCFDPAAGPSYESIFSAWGGDVKEQSIDLRTGKVRQREFSLPKSAEQGAAQAQAKPEKNQEAANNPPALIVAATDPTIYARVDYLDENAGLSGAQEASLKNILKNLPVVFTFAPMNLLYYRVKFKAKSKRLVTVSYSQYCYSDTADPASFQLAYVLHPASLWKKFGDINVEVRVPKSVKPVCSFPLEKDGNKKGDKKSEDAAGDVYRAAIKDDGDKTGELFLGFGQDTWKAATKKKTKAKK
ncbi:MAG: hypothetical protein ABIJ56_18585 [Pseudomonadota bacterium]